MLVKSWFTKDFTRKFSANQRYICEFGAHGAKTADPSNFFFEKISCALFFLYAALDHETNATFMGCLSMILKDFKESTGPI